MSENVLPRKLATIVALDVAGYSARTEADESKTTAEVAALQSVIAEIAARNGGRIFNTAGDGFMLEFASSLAALEATFELAEKCEPKVRIGVHLGDVFIQPNGDLLGHGVNVAARLMAKSDPGCALVSAAVRQAVRGAISDRLVPFGTIKLDKMSETIEAFATSIDQSNRARERELVDARNRVSRLLRLVLGLGGLALAAVAGAVTSLWFAGEASRNGELADVRLSQVLSLYRSNVEEALALQYNAPSRVVVSLLSVAMGKFEKLVEKEREASGSLPAKTASQFIDLQLRFAELMSTEGDRLDEASRSVDVAWAMMDQLGHRENGYLIALLRADALVRRTVVARMKGSVADARVFIERADSEIANAKMESGQGTLPMRLREVSAAALTEHAKLARNTMGTFDGEAEWRSAEGALLSALSLREEIAKGHPDGDLVDREVARALERLGDLHADFGSWDLQKFAAGSKVTREHLEAAIKHYDRSLGILQAVKERAPNDVGIRYDIVAGLQRKGSALGLLGQRMEVARVYAFALEELDDIAETNPDSHVWLQARAAVMSNWGKLELEADDPQAALDHLLGAKIEYDRIAKYSGVEDWKLQERLQTYFLLAQSYRALKNQRMYEETLGLCREQVLRLSKPLQADFLKLCTPEKRQSRF